MSELTDIEARAAEWLAERDRHGDTPTPWPAERQQALDAWLDESTLHRVAWLRLDHTWTRADRLRALHSRARVARRADSARPDAPSLPKAGLLDPWWKRPLLQRTAAGISLGLIALLLAGDPELVARTQHYESALGQREQVALADGSHLTLNTATQVHASVNAGERRVWLDGGEAFFDIAHDAAHPFVIYAGKHRVTVLGTKFSLFRDGDRLRVNVLEGRVQVDAGDGHPTVLTRDEAAVAEARDVLVTRKTPQQLDASLGWMQGKLVFEQVNLADAARQFNRYSRKQLVLGDAAAGQIGIGGVFDADNVEAFARLLHAGFGLDVQVHGDEIRVSTPST